MGSIKKKKRHGPSSFTLKDVLKGAKDAEAFARMKQ
jgi:hypothetical protein